MASASGNSGTFTTTLMQRIDGELICGICLELFKSPVMLTCGHNFCKECVYGMIENGMHFSFISIGPPRSFNCPICQATISINKVTQDGLMSNKALESIVELYKTCSPVDVFDSSWNTDLEISPTMCKLHDKLEDRYCDSCSVAVCVQCERCNHQSYKAKHRVCMLKHAAISYQTEVAEVLTKLKKDLVPLNDKINHLENILRGIQGNQEHISKKLDQQISVLMTLIRQQQEQLMHVLENAMLTRQHPVTAELEKCRAVKTNIQELMKKLSIIRNTKNPTLQLKLMKDTCVQLRAALSFDIPERLHTLQVSDAEIPNWELDTEEIINTVRKLNWQYRLQGAETAKFKDAGTQTDLFISSEAPGDQAMKEESVKLANSPSPHSPSPKQAKTDNTRNKNKSESRKNSTTTTRMHDIRSLSPDQVMADRDSFDEIDGNFPLVSREIDKDIESVKLTEIIPVKDKKGKKTVEELKLHSINKPAIKSGDDYLTEVIKTLKIEERKRGRGRSSFPLESLPQLSDKNVSETIQESVIKTKKSHSDRDLNKGENSQSYSPTNAEALAKFVARRRTMSPSVSSPSLKSLEQSYCKSEENEITKTRKNTSSPSLKCLNGTFSEIVCEKNEEISLLHPPVSQISEKFGSENDKENQENSSLTTKKDMDNSSEKLLSDTWETKQKERQDMIKVSVTQTGSSTMKDTTGSSPPKSFSKKPIGLNLDLHLAHHEESAKYDCKRITEV